MDRLSRLSGGTGVRKVGEFTIHKTRDEFFSVG